MSTKETIAEERKLRHEAIIADLDAGLTWDQAAAKHGVSRVTIGSHAKQEKARRAALEQEQIRRAEEWEQREGPDEL